jgi:dihydroorotate dehydrogenase electron transfer subunit
MTTQNTYKVVSNKKLCPHFYRLSIDAPPLARKTAAGQFIHIRIKDGLEPFFRRPFSVYRAQKHVEILYEVVGKGTAMLADKKKGDDLDILGPLGRPFSMPPKGTKQVIMIAGGVGIAPFLILSDSLKKKGYQMLLLYGGRSRGHIYDMKEFRKNGCTIHIATNDGSVGTKGYVSALFPKVKPDPRTNFVYTCGPRPMILSVQKFAKKHRLDGETSCEEVMACGLGACLGCAIQTTSGYKTVCHDGPVFDLQEVVFKEESDIKAASNNA